MFPFVGYEFHLDLALVNPLREMAQFSGFYPTLTVRHVFDFRMFDVANWVACLNRENGPGGTPSHETPFQFHLKEYWRYPQLLDTFLPWSETISAHLQWWQNPANVMNGADLHRKDHSIQLLQTPQTKAGALTQELVSIRVCGHTGKRLHINILELKAVSLVPQRFKDQCQTKLLVATDNSTVVAYINNREEPTRQR